MYFWRIEARKADLAGQPLTDRQVLPYLVLYSVLMSAVSFIPFSELNTWNMAGALWSVLLAVVGTIYIYRRNGGEQGLHLLQRYLAIGWVVGIRWTAALLAIAVVYFGVLEAVGEVPDNTTWPEFVLLAAAQAAWYWRIGHHIAEVASRGTQRHGGPLVSDQSGP